MSALVSKIDVVAWLNESAVIDEGVKKAALRLVRKTPATTLNRMGDDAVLDVPVEMKTTAYGAAIVGQVFVDTVTAQRADQAARDAVVVAGIEEATLSESERPKVEHLPAARRRSAKAKRGGGAVERMIEAEEKAAENPLEALI